MGRLTQYDREQIEYCSKLGMSGRAIAKKIGRHHSVVERELTRNRSPYFVYEAAKALYFSARRAKRTNTRKLLKSEALREYVIAKLHLDWSPEQIAGRLKEFPAERPKGLTISHEAIYGWIYEHEPYLYHKLRYKKPDRQKQGQRKHQKQPLIPEMVSITERPEEINQRTEVGHFESDSSVSA